MTDSRQSKQFAAGVAHHFNHILGEVATSVDRALTSGDTAAMKQALRMTAEAVARMSKITLSLSGFAKCDTLQTDMADLTEIILTFSHLIERSLSEKNIQLKLRLKPVPIIALEVNRMHQALGNLLTNAEEAMPKGGTVTISLDSRKDAVELTFADSGCGISADQLDMVFEPFFTTKGTLADRDDVNPGLGLSIVHGIVTEMGGSIEARSPKSSGAKFIITFPIPKDS